MFTKGLAMRYGESDDKRCRYVVVGGVEKFHWSSTGNLGSPLNLRVVLK